MNSVLRNLTSPEAINAVSHAACIVAIASLVVASQMPDLHYLAGSLAGISTLLLWLLRQVGHKRNIALRAQVLSLGGTIGALDEKVDDQKPKNHTSAAIFGQSELATMTYDRLIARMRADKHIP